MHDEEKQTPAEEQEQKAPPAANDEAIEIPANKYERIMMAAAEASRLNEEMRRKGIKIDRKVTIEALKRVDERRVKAVLENKESLERTREALAKAGPPETFFLNPLPMSDSEPEEGRGGGHASDEETD